jgi:hypothetical protein
MNDSLDDEQEQFFYVKCDATTRVSKRAVDNIAKAQKDKQWPVHLFDSMAALDISFFETYSKDNPFELPLCKKTNLYRDATEFIIKYTCFYTDILPQVYLPNLGEWKFTYVCNHAKEIFGSELEIYQRFLTPYDANTLPYVCAVISVAEYYNCAFLQKNLCFLISSHINDPKFHSLILNS